MLAEPRVSWNGADLQLRTRKGLFLLCYLARQARPVNRRWLAERLWPDSDSALANLRWELHQLRRLPGSHEWLKPDTESVAVAAVSDIQELQQFDHAEVLKRTATLPYAELEVPGVPAISEWLAEEREAVAAVRLAALKHEAARLAAASRITEARVLVQEALSSDPLDETLHRTGMRLALMQGDVFAAQSQFEACRRMLASEFGIGPSAATLELAAALGSAAGSKGPDSVSRSLPPELLYPPKLIGRDSEWAQLQLAWQRNQIMFISGPAGSGKTRLAHDFIRSLAEPGKVTVLRGFASDADTPLSTYARGWRSVLERQPELLQQLPAWVQEEAVRHLPELQANSALGVRTRKASSLRQVRALNELYRRHLNNCAAALVDDTHLFDADSWVLGGSALHELTQGDADLDCRIIVTLRSDELPKVLVPHLRSLVARGRAVHIELGELTEPDIAELLRNVAQSAEEAGRLFSLAGGSPFAVLEVLRLVRSNPELNLGLPAQKLLPDSLRELNSAMLARLSAAAQHVAELLAASVITAEADLAGRLEAAEVRAALGELHRHGLTTGFRLANELLRETILLARQVRLP